MACLVGYISLLLRTFVVAFVRVSEVHGTLTEYGFEYTQGFRMGLCDSYLTILYVYDSLFENRFYFHIIILITVYDHIPLYTVVYNHIM